MELSLAAFLELLMILVSANMMFVGESVFKRPFMKKYEQFVDASWINFVPFGKAMVSEKAEKTHMINSQNKSAYIFNVGWQ